MSQVLVLGTNFRRSSRLGCRFGSTAVDARMAVPAALFLNSSAIVCISPSLPKRPGSPDGTRVAVEVSNNAAPGGRAVVSSTFSHSGVLFQYENMPRMESVFPRLGPASGNFSVRVVGGTFPETPELRCDPRVCMPCRFTAEIFMMCRERP